jgi:DNA replication protein DnaC
MWLAIPSSCDNFIHYTPPVLTGAFTTFPLLRLHESIGDPTLADAILDRLIHNAHRINLKGGSMRKKLKLDAA